jgi:hypothetical protein
MYMNLLLLFICINVFLPLMTVEGLPFYNPDSCFYHADTAPHADPAKLIQNSSGAQYDTETLMQEMRSPTNSTDGNPFDSLTQPYEQLYQGLDTAKEYILGGYITKIIDHVAINCVTDPNTSPPQSVIGYIDNNPTSTSYNQLITKYINSGTGTWLNNTCGSDDRTNGLIPASTPCYVENEVLNQFKSGINLIMGFLIVFLIFYWITGKGHLITS